MDHNIAINSSVESSYRPFASVRGIPEQVQDDITENIFLQVRPKQILDSQILVEERVNIEKWIQLQRQLKEEMYRMQQEQQIKNQLQEELRRESEQYYQAYINVLEENAPTGGERKLFNQIDRLFGNASTNIRSILEELIKSPSLMAKILQHHNKIIITQKIQQLLNTIVHNFYDNVACPSMWSQPIIKLMSEMIKIEIEKSTQPDFRWDQDVTIAKFMMGEFAKRPENVKYTKYTFKSSLLGITKVDRFLDLDRINIANKLRDLKSKQQLKEKQERQHQQSLNLKTSTPIMQRSITTIIKPTQYQQYIRYQIDNPKQNYNGNYAEYYAYLIKTYDLIMKQGNKKDQKKNVHQLGDYAKKLLQFDDEQKNAKFISLDKRGSLIESTNEPPSRRLSDVYSHQNRSEALINDEVQKILNACIEKSKQLVNNLMENIFKSIYTLPVGLRIICKLIQIHLKNKYPNITQQQLQDNIFSFLFNVWLIPQYTFPQHYKSFKFIKDEHELAIKQIHMILKKLILRVNYDDDIVYYKLNSYMQDMQGSLSEYLNEILNVCPVSVQQIIDNQVSLELVQSDSLCIAMQDIQQLCVLLSDLDKFQCEDQKLQTLVSRLQKYASSTQKIDRSEPIFGSRMDLQQGQCFQIQQIYALKIEFKLPDYLNQDYYSFYKPFSKIKIGKNDDQNQKYLQKLANILRQILLEVQDISLCAATGNDDISIKKVLTQLEEKHTIMGDQEIVYHLQYIQYCISNLPIEQKTTNMKDLYEYMAKEYDNRLNIENQLIGETKYQFLKAKFNIHKNYEDMLESLNQLKQERRQKQLYDIVETAPFSFCITSPKSREGLFQARALKYRNNQPQEENKIWLEDCKDCIHNAINLEFIKQIVGGSVAGDSGKKVEQNKFHCHDIKQFIDIFSGLQEVKDAVITGKDEVGVKSAYFEFIKTMAEYLKSKDQFNLDDNQIIEMLEKYISKRIYDKIYPKERTYKDAGLYFRIKSLDWITYDHLDISKNNRVDEMWMLAADALLQMDNNKTAVSKLDSMIQCTKIMTDVLKLTALKDEATSADTMLPIMIYLLLKAAPQRLHSNLNFVKLFLDESKQVGQQGYCISQIELAISFLEKVTSHDLKMEELQYLETIHKQEIKFGIFYTQKRNRSERITHHVIQG
ncbi:hypothetical protein pb186bvf_012538 [Paramecium bursaria]